MTRGGSPGSPTRHAAGVGPGGPGDFSARSFAPPARAFSRLRVRLTGQICITCLRPIHGPGLRLTRATLTTHAHLGCVAAAVKLLA